MLDAKEVKTPVKWDITLLVVRNGIIIPIKPASNRPTITNITDVSAFFPASPNMNPSARSKTIATIPANVPGTRLKDVHSPN